MAKRKYVKENNLVKAINTDSLELQKPLVNEYYDINVHNSNMDKIDAGYRQNKNDISNINYELSKTENTKYTTENGVKEFSCKDGYIDNVTIEGETLVNLCRKIKDVEINTDKELLELYGNNNHTRISNGIFTVINTSNKTIYFDFKDISNNSHLGKNSLSYGSLVVEVPSNGYIKSLYGYFTDGWTSNDINEFEKSIVILEGDHTDKPVNYFEGLKSVGQGDNIEILTRNSNETKQDKKQISTTLRSLPNGVKDTIEKRGNKYVKVQRCGEVTLNGSENWAYNGTLVNGNEYVALNNFTGQKTNSRAYCDCFNSVSSFVRDVECIHVSDLGFNLSISSSKVGTSTSQSASDRKATILNYIKSNPITVVYELATPIVTELPNFNPQTYSDNTTLLINSGVVQGECSFEVTNSMGSEIEVLKDKVSSLDDNIYMDYTDSLMFFNGWKPYNNEKNMVSIVKEGKTVTLSCLLSNADAVVDSGTPIMSVPFMCTPKKWTSFCAISGSTNKTIPISIRHDNGGVILDGHNIVREPVWVALQVSYITN